MMLYLDNAATTLKKPLSVYATLFKSTLFSGGNAGRGGHKMSMDAVRAIVDTQDLIAQLFNIKKAENVVFTQNATYALNHCHSRHNVKRRTYCRYGDGS